MYNYLLVVVWVGINLFSKVWFAFGLKNFSKIDWNIFRINFFLCLKALSKRETSLHSKVKLSQFYLTLTCFGSWKLPNELFKFLVILIMFSNILPVAIRNTIMKWPQQPLQKAIFCKLLFSIILLFPDVNVCQRKRFLF